MNNPWFFQDYVPMTEDEKRKHSENFVKILNEIGIKDVKDIQYKQDVEINNRPWIIKWKFVLSIGKINIYYHAVIV